MRRRMSAMVEVGLFSAAMLLLLLHSFGSTETKILRLVNAAPAQTNPTPTTVNPGSASNDLDTHIVITGTDFENGARVWLDDNALDDVGWVNADMLTATVPWGLEPDVYTLIIVNPGGESGMLSNALTVTEGLGVWNATELFGGAVNEVSVNPHTPETVYAVSDDVGMFRSEDSAASWTFQVAGGEYSVRNLAIDPISPTVMYMHMPWDLHRSDDGGDTWTPLNAPGDIPFPHPKDSGTIFVSNRWEGESGLWKSTDYGQTWLTMTTGMTDTRVNNLVFDPTDPMTIYVGTELGNLFVSADGGGSWAFVDQPLDLVQKLTINPRGDHELWVSNSCFSQPQTTLKSTNESHTSWATIPDPVGMMSLKSIEFAPDAWGGAYSQTLFVSGCFEEVMVSNDGGNAWDSIDPQADEWHSGLSLHSSDPDTLYVTGNHQGIYKTTNGGTTWQVAHKGLTALIPDHLTTVTDQPGTLYAVTEIGLLKGIDGGATWQSLPVGGDVKFVTTDPFTPSRVYAAGGDVGMGQDLPVYISTDSGQTWQITSHLTEPPQYNLYAHLDPILSPDPSQPGVLLAGVRHAIIATGGAEAGSLYRSTDAGLTWIEIDVGQTISPVKDIAFNTVDPSIVYLATSGDWHDSGSGLFRSIDSGLTWQPIGADISDLDRVEDIAVEPRPPYRVFALASGRVYVSKDQGITWTQSNIFHGAIRSILSSHDSPNSILYLVGGMGLRLSTDGGNSWEQADGILGQVPTYSLAEMTTGDRVVLYAGTTGGYIEGASTQEMKQVNLDGTLVNAGVYRYVTQLIHHLFLPLALR